MAEEQESLGDNLESGFGKIEQFVETNQKQVAIGAGVVAVLVAVVIYVFAVWIPQENTKAQKAMYMAELAFARDSFSVALNGNGANKGFIEVASKYSLTPAGKLANYYAGICCLNLKKYDDAIKYLDKFSTNDAIIGALKLSAIGDAYSELGKLDDGIKYYEKAANFSDNENYTPYFLFKTGLAYEKQKKNAEAKKIYEKIRDQYPNSDEGRDIEKYIARVSGNNI